MQLYDTPLITTELYLDLQRHISQYALHKSKTKKAMAQEIKLFPSQLEILRMISARQHTNHRGSKRTNQRKDYTLKNPDPTIHLKNYLPLLF